MFDPLAQEAADRAEDAATRAVWTADPRPDLPDHDVWRRLLSVAYARGGAGWDKPVGELLRLRQRGVLLRRPAEK